MKDIEHASIGGSETVTVAAALKPHAAGATAPAVAKAVKPVAKRRRIDPVGKFLLENRGALGAGHKLDL